MNFDFSDDQKTIQDQARLVLSRECPPDRARQALEHARAYDETLWKQVAELGWPAIAIDEEFGGLGMGYLELCVIAQELGRAVAPLPFTASVYLATEAVKLCASDTQKAEWLPQLASGDAIACVALPETRSLNHGAINTVTAIDAVLNGTAQAVLHGHAADFAIVAARDEAGRMAFYKADLNNSAIQRQVQQTIDPSQAMATLQFTDAPSEPLGNGEDFPHCYQQLLDRAAVLLSFEQVGGCEAVIDMAKTYTEGRYAFGRQVASFQAIKHKLADMFVAKELAKSNAYYGAWAMTDGERELPLAAATARVSAINAYYLCSKENIQAHGGMGFTWEFDCHLYYRRAQLLSSVIGSAPVWKNRLTEQLLTA
ncbi:acyl-CoA dehydrogenase family protein [Spongiibacter marinus]|uniref:acyl-CoA dehydrogenase family protein n=1 Tax=Spongiibacter marinus TaxID=354246 RepID=UPI000418884E|nr:acyl-CoA dehydrogenase family protein [Spongiibacter marinus]